MFSSMTVGSACALCVVVSSDLKEGMHRLLVLDGGLTGWKDGSLRTYGELSDWPDDLGPKRLA